MGERRHIFTSSVLVFSLIRRNEFRCFRLVNHASRLLLMLTTKVTYKILSFFIWFCPQSVPRSFSLTNWPNSPLCQFLHGRSDSHLQAFSRTSPHYLIGAAPTPTEAPLQLSVLHHLSLTGNYETILNLFVHSIVISR